MKLGKLAARKDERTLMLTKYLTEALPANPQTFDWSSKVTVPFGMMANDTIGDCTCASAGHMEMSFTADNGDLFVPTDEQIIDAYSAITGYNPGNPDSDTGANELDVLNYWKNIGIAGHKIGAYTQANPSIIDEIKSAIYLFGGCYLGVQLPLTAQGQNSWDLISTDGNGAIGSWGGHAVPALAFDENSLSVITWGEVLKMSWEFFTTYVDEAYAILSPDFVNGTKPAPNGFDMNSLVADLKLLNV